jgi:hypothetical protein
MFYKDSAFKTYLTQTSCSLNQDQSDSTKYTGSYSVTVPAGTTIYPRVGVQSGMSLLYGTSSPASFITPTSDGTQDITGTIGAVTVSGAVDLSGITLPAGLPSNVQYTLEFKPESGSIGMTQAVSLSSSNTPYSIALPENTKYDVSLQLSWINMSSLTSVYYTYDFATPLQVGTTATTFDCKPSGVTLKLITGTLQDSNGIPQKNAFIYLVDKTGTDYHTIMDTAKSYGPAFPDQYGKWTTLIDSSTTSAYVIYDMLENNTYYITKSKVTLKDSGNDWKLTDVNQLTDSTDD